MNILYSPPKSEYKHFVGKCIECGTIFTDTKNHIRSLAVSTLTATGTCRCPSCYAEKAKEVLVTMYSSESDHAKAILDSMPLDYSISEDGEVISIRTGNG